MGTHPRREAAEESLSCPDKKYKLGSTGGMKSLETEEQGLSQKIALETLGLQRKWSVQREGGMGRRDPTGKSGRKPQCLKNGLGRNSHSMARVSDSSTKPITRFLTKDGVNISTVFHGKVNEQGNLCFLCEHFCSFLLLSCLSSQEHQKDIFPGERNRLLVPASQNLHEKPNTQVCKQ